MLVTGRRNGRQHALGPDACSLRGVADEDERLGEDKSARPTRYTAVVIEWESAREVVGLCGRSFFWLGWWV